MSKRRQDFSRVVRVVVSDISDENQEAKKLHNETWTDRIHDRVGSFFFIKFLYVFLVKSSWSRIKSSKPFLFTRLWIELKRREKSRWSFLDKEKKWLDKLKRKGNWSKSLIIHYLVKKGPVSLCWLPHYKIVESRRNCRVKSFFINKNETDVMFFLDIFSPTFVLYYTY